MDALTHVAVGILQKPNGDFLLCQRPKNKVYAGFWEFPGGKVEKGEELETALKREIQEELNLEILSAFPWISRVFLYPHARVCLHFFKIKEWRGNLNPHTIEHADFYWQSPFAPLKNAPLLPANHAVLPLLVLPEMAFITAAEINGEEKELERLKNALIQFPRALVQLRDKTLFQRENFAKKIATLCQEKNALLVINDDENLARKVKARGVHSSSFSLKKLQKRPDFPFCGASVHNLEELKRAQTLNLDYVFLSPIFPTPSHPNAPALGKDSFKALIQHTPIPVFALGGVAMHDLPDLQRLGAHGIALLRGY